MLTGVAALAFTLTACGDPPQPAPPPDAETPAPLPVRLPRERPAPPGVPDPEEPGISDLARVSRYIFQQMNDRTTGCSNHNPYTTALTYQIAVRTEGDRITSLTLAGITADRDGTAMVVDQALWPPAIVAYVACLETPLKAVELRPGVADGTLRSAFIAAANPQGEPLPL